MVSLLGENMRPLPKQVEEICLKDNAPPRLVAHLTLVHDVACSLVEECQARLPGLKLDAESVTFGAATHDIGKALYPAELVEAGSRHEAEGERLLRECGVEASRARFARTHAAWRTDASLSLEDLFVTLADTYWKGKRLPELDGVVAKRVAAQTAGEEWEVYLVLDDILQKIWAGADQRLAWQSKFPV
jgi:hypothetical protein